MNNPQVLSIISVVFALLAAYNLYTGSRRMRDARRAGKPIRWYRQTTFLTGIEYSLLTFVFLLSVANQTGTIAPNVRGLVGVLYFVLLIPAAIIAGLVIREAILSARANRAHRASAVSATTIQTASTDKPERALSKHEQEELAQRQRERRKKAAAARRRRAGKA
jgi:heme/copper-type cytochrome/quinol oxidase subunit 2